MNEFDGLISQYYNPEKGFFTYEVVEYIQYQRSAFRFDVDSLIAKRDLLEEVGHSCMNDYNLVINRRLFREFSRTIPSSAWKVKPLLYSPSYKEKFLAYRMYMIGRLLNEEGETVEWRGRV